MLSKLMISILVNIALNKPTYQLYPYATARSNYHPSMVEASNAVDGLKSDLSFTGGQCVISENKKQTATWWVNLTNILSIHHITIYYRTENEEWGTNLMMNACKLWHKFARNRPNLTVVIFHFQFIMKYLYYHRFKILIHLK